jgi:hypothetical protein
VFQVSPAPVLLLPSRPLGVRVSWQWKLFAASPSSSRQLSTQFEIRQRHISNDDNGRQRILTGPIQRQSSSSSVLPSDSASQFASTLSEPEASSTEHTVKRRKLRAIATWDHFRGAQGDEPRAISGNLLHYCKRCRNPSWSTHISGNARYHLKKAHHIFVREDSSSQNKRQLAIENAFARTTAKQLQQVREHERNTLRSVINVDAFREAQMLLSAHRHLPLNFVTWPEYQALLTAVNPYLGI